MLIHIQKCRNEAQRRIKVAKKDHYMNLIKDNKNEPKKLWKALKEMGCGGKANSGKPNIGLDIKGKIDFNKAKVANYFNIFYFFYLCSQ